MSADSLIQIRKLAQTAGFQRFDDHHLAIFQQKFVSVESEYRRRYNDEHFSITQESQTDANKKAIFFQSLFILTPPMCIAVLRLTDNRKILSMRYEYEHELSSALTVEIGLDPRYGDEEDTEEFTSSSLDDIEFFKLLYSCSITRNLDGNRLLSLGLHTAYPHIPWPGATAPHPSPEQQT